MTDFEDPPRWADSADAPPRLKSLFAAARNEVATDRELADLAARLGPMLGPSAPGPVPGASLLMKLGAGAVIAAVGLGGGYYARSKLTHRSDPNLPVSAPQAVAPAQPVPAIPEAPSTPTTAPEADAPPAAPSPSVHGAEHKAAAAHRDEASLLEQARHALAGNPARALALTTEHAKTFPNGVLAQEREVIAIAALRRLGRTAEAERRAESFDRNYPNSAHQRTVDAEPAK